jgi:hypothetical protein
MWKNTVGPGRPQMTIWRMRFVYWITKATDTHSKYVILIPFPQQKRLSETVSAIRLNVTASLVRLYTTNTYLMYCTVKHTTLIFLFSQNVSLHL